MTSSRCYGNGLDSINYHVCGLVGQFYVCLQNVLLHWYVCPTKKKNEKKKTQVATRTNGVTKTFPLGRSKFIEKRLNSVESIFLLKRREVKWNILYNKNVVISSARWLTSVLLRNYSRILYAKKLPKRECDRQRNSRCLLQECFPSCLVSYYYIIDSVCMPYFWK